MLLKGILLSLLTCLCWGSTSVCLRGLKGLDPIDMSFLRAIGGFAASVPLAILFSSGPGLLSLPAGDIGVLIALVLFNNIIGDVFLFLSLHRLGVARGASVSSTYPVVVAILSALWFGERLTFNVSAGTILVVAGVFCLCGKKGSNGRIDASGVTFALMASFFWGIGLLCNKYLLRDGIMPDLIVAGRGITFLVAAAVGWAMKSFVFGKKEDAWKRITAPEAKWALLAGVLSLGVGAWTYSSALRFIPASVATPIGASNPILATILAFLIFHEEVSFFQWFGILLAVGGSVLVTLP
mgnify:FL=1